MTTTWRLRVVHINAPRPAPPRRSELLAQVAAGDTAIVSKLSYLGRSLREVLALIEELIHQKRGRLLLVQEGLGLDPQSHRDMAREILLTISAMLAELERVFRFRAHERRAASAARAGYCAGQAQGRGATVPVRRRPRVHFAPVGYGCAGVAPGKVSSVKGCPALQYLLTRLRPGDAPAAWKPGRLGRSLEDLVALVSGSQSCQDG